MFGAKKRQKSTPFMVASAVAGFKKKTIIQKMRASLKKTPDELKSKEETSKAARKRWKALIRLIIQKNKAERMHKISINAISDAYGQERSLLGQIKRSKRLNTRSSDVFSLLKSQARLTEKVFARQKFSAKEVLYGRRSIPQGRSIQIEGKSIDLTELTMSIYDRRNQQRYPITPEIQKKMDEIKAKRKEPKKKSGLSKFIEGCFRSTIFGQSVLADRRFYSMDPLVHLPDLCRRCRRPLQDTLTSRFTAAGIIFALLIPILGILLLFANKEFVCVVCDEMYVYGDLTARPNDGEDHRHRAGRMRLN